MYNNLDFRQKDPFQRISVNTKCAYRLGLAGLAGWLAGTAEISELERVIDFRFVAVDSVGHEWWTIQKILDQAPSIDSGTLEAKYLCG